MSEQEISTRYRAYCNACQSGHLEKLPEFWDLPAMFTVDTAGTTQHSIITTSDELIKLYSGEFGSKSTVDKSVIDKEDIEMYGSGAATVKTILSHYGKGELHDRQFATYGARFVGGKWMFCSHMSRVELA